MAGVTEWTAGDSLALMPIYYALGFIVMGLIQGLLGYKIFKIQVAVIVFLGGFYIGYAALGTTVSHVLGLILGAVLGVALAGVSVKVYRAGVFLFVGMWIGLIVDAATGMWWVGVIAGVLAGLLGAAMVKPAIIISSSLAGASMGAAGVLGLIRWDNSVVLAIISAVAAGFFIVFQFGINKELPQQGAGTPGASPRPPVNPPPTAPRA